MSCPLIIITSGRTWQEQATRSIGDDFEYPVGGCNKGGGVVYMNVPGRSKE